MCAQVQFTQAEISILRPLVGSYPLYCPYANLLACFHKAGRGAPTEKEIEFCRERMLRAQEDGTWDQFLRPMRSVVSRTRFKVQALGFEILPVEETGYLLRHKAEIVTEVDVVCAKVEENR
jgi:hypothetical protein